MMPNVDIDRVWGWRGRVGLIVLSSQQVTEPLFYAVAPEGLSFHTSRLEGMCTSARSVAEMEKHVPRAIEKLVQVRVQCIAYMCVAGGLFRGRAKEEQFCADVKKKTGIPLVSALLSVLEALTVLKLHKIVVVSPYVHDIDKMERKFLRNSGFEVVGSHNLGISDTFEIGQVISRDIARFCETVWDKSAEGLYIGCCAFNAMPVAGLIERELGVPVVTAHTAVLWKVIKVLGIKETIPGFGRLLSEYV